ncbi:MAG TPA: cytochrome c3 family protein [Nitrospiria bacterium]
MKKIRRLGTFCFAPIFGLFLFISVVFFGAHSAITQAPPGLPTPPPPVLEDVVNTRHNLSATTPDQAKFESLYGSGSSRNIFTTETTEICVFCHTPHGSNAAGAAFKAPIWNRNLSTASYILYDQTWSKSFEGEVNPGAPTGYSRLCLSCHDGTIALGSVVNRPGSGGYNADPFNLTYPNANQVPPIPNTIPVGSGEKTGDTRRLGTDLRNDHPISFRFDTQLAVLDTELVDPGPNQQVPAKVSDATPISPMRRYDGATVGVYDSVQCTSCHNPHAVTYPKFLRANWFHNETNNPDPSRNHPGEPILCIYCHEKPGWIQSTHSVSQAVRNKYPLVNNDPNNPSSGYDYDGSHAVGEFACRNCHDPHTAEGAKRLHREGVDTFAGNDSVENTCYLCHSPNTASITPLLPAGDPTSPSFPRFIDNGQTVAPDIYSEFAKDTLEPSCITFPECGSAMNLRLDALNPSHSPFFLARPQEGVQLMSQGVSETPARNEETPGSTTPDLPHVECVDCHNPHQVISPAIDPPGRIKGMKGVGIDNDLTFGNPIVVGRGEIGTDIDGRSTDRDPYVYEVCFRCHGNSYTNIFGPNVINNSSEDRFPQGQVTTLVPKSTQEDGLGTVTLDPFVTSVRSDPRAPAPNNLSFSFKGFSNKFKEFNPRSDMVITDSSGTPRTISNNNTAYHPVVARGRNGTTQLANQLAGAFPTAADPTQRTINCTDCHNNDATSSSTLQMGPVTFSNLRPTDEPPPVFQDSSSDPVGPHGSRNIRILRARYNTDILDPARCFERGNPTLAQCSGSDGYNAGWFDNFLLCFQCHNRRAFDPNFGSRTDPNWSNFFGMPTNPDNHWNGNLHMYHLQYSGAMCHECHYNVHSNVEAQNTIYGDGLGNIANQGPPCNNNPGYPCLPPDSEDGIFDGVVDTHLINFGPQAEGTIDVKPKWAYVWDSSVSAYRFKCYLRCHNETMDTCAYQTMNPNEEADNDAFNPAFPGRGTQGTTWCAGGATVD